MNTYIFELYVTGDSVRSRHAVTTARALFQERLGNGYELKVIDVLEHPDLAEGERILATPALLRKAPEPVRRIIGDLSDHEKVLFALDLDSPLQTEEGVSDD